MYRLPARATSTPRLFAGSSPGRAKLTFDDEADSSTSGVAGQEPLWRRRAQADLYLDVVAVCYDVCPRLDEWLAKTNTGDRIAIRRGVARSRFRCCPLRASVQRGKHRQVEAQAADRQASRASQPWGVSAHVASAPSDALRNRDASSPTPGGKAKKML